METLYILLAICEGNHQWPVDSPHKAELWYFLCCKHDQAVEQTVGQPFLCYDAHVMSLLRILYLINGFSLYRTSYSTNNDVKRALKQLKSLATWLFVQQFVQANIKDDIKVPHYWSFVRGIHQTGGFPSQMASDADFHVMMTSQKL